MDGIPYAQYPEGTADDGKHAESVIGVDIRLLEPYRRLCVGGRGFGGACGFKGYGVQNEFQNPWKT